MTTNGTDPCAELRADNEWLRATVKELRAELADVTAERDEAGRTLGAAAAELARYKREVAELRAEVTDLRTALALVMWMAEEYAESGGSNGPEMRAYRDAEELARPRKP